MAATAERRSTTVPPPDLGLRAPIEIGGIELANRVFLAPLAGIGSWFVRLQARRHGAGLAVSEMVSSFAIAHGNRRTLEEMLRIHPDEHPVSVQLFGPDPGVMRVAAAAVAEAGADLIDINMGCPVPKVCKTGAGAALLADPDRAVAVARAAVEGSALPVTVKVRSGREPGERSGFELARRLVEEAGVAAIGFHPRPAASHHSGRPDYALAAELQAALDVPLVLSGGLRTAAQAQAGFERSGADAVMIARGSLGNPWIFEELLGLRDRPPSGAEVVGELRWLLDCGEAHFGAERAARNLRKFYPWYLERLGIARREADAYQRTRSLDEVRRMLCEQFPAAVPERPASAGAGAGEALSAGSVAPL